MGSLALGVGLVSVLGGCGFVFRCWLVVLLDSVGVDCWWFLLCIWLLSDSGFVIWVGLFEIFGLRWWLLFDCGLDLIVWCDVCVNSFLLWFALWV